MCTSMCPYTCRIREPMMKATTIITAISVRTRRSTKMRYAAPAILITQIQSKNILNNNKSLVAGEIPDPLSSKPPSGVAENIVS